MSMCARTTAAPASIDLNRRSWFMVLCLRTLKECDLPNSLSSLSIASSYVPLLSVSSCSINLSLMASRVSEKVSELSAQMIRLTSRTGPQSQSSLFVRKFIICVSLRKSATHKYFRHVIVQHALCPNTVNLLLRRIANQLDIVVSFTISNDDTYVFADLFWA